MWEEGEFSRGIMKSTEEWQKLQDRWRREEENENWRKKIASRNDERGGFSNSSGWGMLVFLGIAGFVLYKIYMFIKANWVSIVTILGICVACVITCIIIHIKAKKTGLKTLFTVLAAAGLIGTVLYSGPRKTEAFFVNLQHMIPKLEQKTIIESTPTSTAIYAYVITDALNVRTGPSVGHEIVGQLLKDQRVEIADNSGQWWKIKSENIEGYVDSDCLRQE